MKYKFVSKAKMPSPAEIKGTMNFGKVVANSKVLAGAKITSAVLKGTAAVKSAVVSTVSVAVVATSTYVVYPELFQKTTPEPEIMTETPFVIPADTVATEEPVVVDSSGVQPSVLADTISSVPAATNTRSNKKIPRQSPTQNDNHLVDKNILIRASPLPDTDALMSHIHSQLKYPIQHLGDSIQGYVKLLFKVNEEGQTENVKVLESLGKAFDSEAIRVIRSYKKWRPASYNGKPQEGFFQIDIKFEIK